MENSGTLLLFMNDIKPEVDGIYQSSHDHWSILDLISPLPRCSPCSPWSTLAWSSPSRSPWASSQASWRSPYSRRWASPWEWRGGVDQASWKQIKDEARLILMMKLLRLCDTVIISSLLNCPFRSVIAFKALPSPTTYGPSASIS